MVYVLGDLLTDLTIENERYYLINSRVKEIMTVGKFALLNTVHTYIKYTCQNDVLFPRKQLD